MYRYGTVIPSDPGLNLLRDLTIAMLGAWLLQYNLNPELGALSLFSSSGEVRHFRIEFMPAPIYVTDLR